MLKSPSNFESSLRVLFLQLIRSVPARRSCFRGGSGPWYKIHASKTPPFIIYSALLLIYPVPANHYNPPPPQPARNTEGPWRSERPARAIFAIQWFGIMCGPRERGPYRWLPAKYPHGQECPTGSSFLSSGGVSISLIPESFLWLSSCSSLTEVRLEFCRDIEVELDEDGE